jgi:hypothetical protein
MGVRPSLVEVYAHIRVDLTVQRSRRWGIPRLGYPPGVFNFLFGWMFSRHARNSRLPESVKQQRYDERAARRRNPSPVEQVVDRALAKLRFWPTVVVLIAACVAVVLLTLIAIALK